MRRSVLCSLASGAGVVAITVWAVAQQASMPADAVSTTMAATAPTTTAAPGPVRQRPLTPSPSQPTTSAMLPAERFATRYAVIEERNIFLRDRAPRRVSQPTDAWGSRATPNSAPSQEQSLVLRGIVMEDDVFRAYFENTGSSQMIRVAAGDAIARGRIAEIGVDAVLYEAAQGQQWVNVGDNLAGARVTLTAAIAPVGAAAAGGAPSLTPGALQSVEERMRAARAARQGGGAPPAPPPGPAVRPPGMGAPTPPVPPESPSPGFPTRDMIVIPLPEPPPEASTPGQQQQQQQPIGDQVIEP